MKYFTRIVDGMIQLMIPMCGNCLIIEPYEHSLVKGMIMVLAAMVLVIENSQNYGSRLRPNNGLEPEGTAQ